MVRQMAYAMCGGDTPYRWFPQAIREVYRQNGVAGFFQGLIPSLLADMLVLSSVISVYRILRLYFFRDFDPAVLVSSFPFLILYAWSSPLPFLYARSFPLPYIVRMVLSPSLFCTPNLFSFQHAIRSILWLFHSHYVQEPLQLVSDVLALRGAGLALPADPGEVASGSWVTCWDYLVNAEQLLRGSNWFIRRHIRPNILKSLPEI